MFEQIIEMIRAHGRIILHRHKNPDGDALGSQVGLWHILRDSSPAMHSSLTVPWTN